MKTEYDDFKPEKRDNNKGGAGNIPKARSGLLIQDEDEIETREDADNLSDESPEPRMEAEPKSLLRQESPKVDTEPDDAGEKKHQTIDHEADGLAEKSQREVLP